MKGKEPNVIQKVSLWGGGHRELRWGSHEERAGKEVSHLLGGTGSWRSFRSSWGKMSTWRSQREAGGRHTDGGAWQGLREAGGPDGTVL